MNFKEFIELMVKAAAITGKLKNPKEEVKSVQFEILDKSAIKNEARYIFK